MLQAFREWRGFEIEQLAAASSLPADHIALAFMLDQAKLEVRKFKNWSISARRLAGYLFRE